MNNDQHLIAEAYKRVYLENDFNEKEAAMDDLAARASEHEDREAAQVKVKDSSWAKKYVPYGPYQVKNYQIGIDGNKGEFVLWKTFDEGEVTYYYYLVYKNEGKLHDINEEQYEHLSDLALSQR
jgi:hypothetical protein